MATNIPQDDFQKTALRLPRELHARVLEAASQSGRSMNAEIIARLQASLDGKPNTQWVAGGSPKDLVGRAAAANALQAPEVQAFLKESLREAMRSAVSELRTLAKEEAEGSVTSPTEAPSKSLAMRKRLRR